jgi:division protein CdvB (Snf7/Vps24/ESCRT-III family)
MSVSGELLRDRIEELRARMQEKEAEIERLRKVVEAQVERLDYLEARHANEFNLLVRVAEVLEKWNIRHRFSELILELREAAK